MKKMREILPRGKEAALASGLLLFYAMELFLSPDPEWTMWAVPMAMGVLWLPDPTALQGLLAAGEVARTMSAAGAFGSIVAAVLLVLQIKTP